MRDTAPGADGIPNSFLRTMGTPFAKAIATLTQASWEIAYYPKRFRTARTVALRKPGKGDYTTPGVWRPIVLLSIIEKIIKVVMVTHFRRIVETHNILLK